MVFGEILKELRIAKGITQSELARRTGCSQGRISDWELEINQPTAQAIIDVANFFDVTTDYLLGKENYDGTKIKTNGGKDFLPVKTVVTNEEQREILAKYDAAPKNIQEAVKKLLS